MRPKPQCATAIPKREAGMNESHLSLHVPQGLDFYRLIDLLFFQKLKDMKYTLFSKIIVDIFD